MTGTTVVRWDGDTMNREQRRLLKSMKGDKLELWVNRYGESLYHEGARDAMLTLIFKLHDEFNFDNEQVDKLLSMSYVWMNGINTEHDITADKIKDTLTDEGITCLSTYGL